MTRGENSIFMTKFASMFFIFYAYGLKGLEEVVRVCVFEVRTVLRSALSSEGTGPINHLLYVTSLRSLRVGVSTSVITW